MPTELAVQSQMNVQSFAIPVVHQVFPMGVNADQLPTVQFTRAGLKPSLRGRYLQRLPDEILRVIRSNAVNCVSFRHGGLAVEFASRVMRLFKSAAEI